MLSPYLRIRAWVLPEIRHLCVGLSVVVFMSGRDDPKNSTLSHINLEYRIKLSTVIMFDLFRILFGSSTFLKIFTVEHFLRLR